MFRFLTFLAFLTFFSFTGSAFVLPTDTVNKIDGKGRKQGTWIKKEEGIIKYKGCFKDDKPVGTFTYYHKNGKMKAISHYSQNGSVSRTKLFDQDGMLEAEGKYIDKLKDSTWVFYFKGGDKISSTEEWKSGKRNGSVKTYLKSGQLTSECTYVNDTPEGACKEYFSNGNIKKEYNLKNGNLDGSFKIYHLNNVPEVAGKYVNSLKEGDWIEYLDNGKTRTRKTYKGGELVSEKRENGTFTDYYDSGIPKLEINYSNGKREGNFKEFYDIGTWKKVLIEDKDGQSESPEYREVLEGQQVKIQGAYQNDKLHGKVITYDEKGKVIKTENYKEGELTK